LSEERRATMIPMNTDAAWLRAKAEAEDNGIVSVDGLVGALAKRAEESKAHRAERIALAKLVELRRRQYRLSAEDLAKKADVDFEDVVSLERAEGTVPESRTMHGLAQALELPEPRLLELAGLVPANDTRFRKATVRFAARSEPVANLLPEEQEALAEFVERLAES
jgi:transcriptional regulator with XRE-family HTH domain